MSTIVDYYRHDTASPVACERCPWTGTFGTLKFALESERYDVVGFSCPACYETVLLSTLPTVDETRAAAKKGNSRAIADLAEAEEQERSQTDREKTLLRSIDQLPELALDVPTRFIWDQETVGKEQWTLIRVGPDGRLIWRECCFWGGCRRFNEVHDLLRARYSPNFEGLGYTKRAMMWLGGDEWGAFGQIGDPPLVTPEGVEDPLAAPGGTPG